MQNTNRSLAVAMLALVVMFFAGTVASAQQLSQPLSGYGGPILVRPTTEAPDTEGDKVYVPSGNLCPQMLAWEKKTGHTLTLGAPIEASEWRPMVIAGGSTAWVWVPIGTRYWEYEGKALFMGPLPGTANVDKNKGTGCCNPVGEGHVPTPAPPPPVPAPPAPPLPSVVTRTTPTPVPAALCNDCFNDKSVRVQQTIVVYKTLPAREIKTPPAKRTVSKSHKKAWTAVAVVGGLIAGGIAYGTSQGGGHGGGSSSGGCGGCGGLPGTPGPH